MLRLVDTTSSEEAKGMFRWLPPAFAVCYILLVSSAIPAETIVSFQEVILLDGQRIGQFSFQSKLLDRAAQTYKTDTVLDLTLKRYGSPVKLRREESTTESAEAVEALLMRQGVPGSNQLLIEGQRDRDTMHIRIDGGRLERHIPWPAGTLGLRRQQTWFAEKKVKPGDRFSFSRYEATYNRVLTVQVEVKEKESVELLGERKSLLRVELVPERLDGGKVSVQPPASVLWLDEAGTILRRQVHLDGLGTTIFLRVSREQAVKTPLGSVDIGARSLIALDRTLTRPYDSRAIVYRVTVRDEAKPTEVFCQDEHQQIREARGASFELQVHPVKPGHKGEQQAELGHLAPSHFIDHEDETITELTRRAIAGEKDPWTKAVRIERYVKHLMRKDNSAELVPASVIAKSLKGDCRHHAFLTTAMCRSAGLPARTAIGLLYVYQTGPKLGFHMWTEVLVDGCWIGIDSTLAKGGVSAAHVKVTDHSWYDTASLAPLLPVNRVLGKVRIEVLKVE